MQRHYVGAPPVEHRFLGLDRRLIPATLAIWALAIFWSVIVPAIDQQIDRRSIEAGTSITVGQDAQATFVPVEGWIYDTLPFPSDPSIRIFKEGITMFVRVGEFAGTSDELMDAILKERDDFEFDGDRRSLVLSQGISGVVQQQTGVNTEAAIFAFASGELATTRTGVEIVVEGPQDSLERNAEDIGRMIASLTINLES